MSKTMLPYEVRWAKPQEWAPAVTMIWRTFLKYEGCDYTEEGIRKFYEFISDDNLYRSFLRGDYLMAVAVDGERVIGAASLRSGNHLSLLFVDEEYHCRGVGKALAEFMCTHLKTEAGEQKISLNAAPYALDFYRKLGFAAVAPEEEYYGIRMTLMEKVL